MMRNVHVRQRTDGDNCGWWCELHQRWTGMAWKCGACDDGMPPPIQSFRPERGKS